MNPFMTVYSGNIISFQNQSKCFFCKKRMQRILGCILLLAAGCSSTEAGRHRIYGHTQPQQHRKGDVVRVFYGKASYYGPGFHGKKTANGEIFNQYALTAAHKTLKFGTRCRVTHRKNGRQVIVRINDRGPYVGDRVIDLSYQAAKVIGGIAEGVMDVQIEILKK